MLLFKERRFRDLRWSTPKKHAASVSQFLPCLEVSPTSATGGFAWVARANVVQVSSNRMAYSSTVPGKLYPSEPRSKSLIVQPGRSPLKIPYNPRILRYSINLKEALTCTWLSIGT